MAQQAVIDRNKRKAESLYKDIYILHGECLRIASHCLTLGFSYDKKINMKKVKDLENLSDNIMFLISDIKQQLHHGEIDRMYDYPFPIMF
jgi:hypothetical protein